MREALACQPAAGLEAVLDAPAARLLVIGASDEAGVTAFAQAICVAAGRGETVRAAWDAARASSWLQGEVARWIAAGAAIELTALPASVGQDRDADQAALAQTLIALGEEGARVIALVDAESAARLPLGLSGETWMPAGARLPKDRAVSVLAVATVTNAPRAALRPIEDIPDHGAARSYDGLIEVSSALPASPAPDDLRGR